MMDMDPIINRLFASSKQTPAVEDKDGVWTWEQLCDAVECTGSFFRNSLKNKRPVAVVVEPGDKRYVAILLGARAAGALVCPIGPEGAEAAISRLNPQILIASTARKLPDGIDVSMPLVESASHLQKARCSENAWGIGTSGSSGRPKTVILKQSSVEHVTCAVQEVVRYRSDDRIHGGLPLHHSYGLSQLWLSIASGACLVLPEGQPSRKNLQHWIGDATVLPTIPSALKMLFQIGFKPKQRLITLAGQAADPGARALFAERCANTRFVYFYGLTEATTRALWLDHEEFFNKPTATGRSIRGVKAWLDENDEMWIDGPNVAAGYLDDEEASCRQFPNGKLRTGDHFSADGDLFFFRGRMDGIFKRFGQKVVPELVEATLVSHPDVTQCLVSEDPWPANSEEPAPVAWLVTRKGKIDRKELLKFARKRLPAVMVPVKFFLVPALEITYNGKLVRTPPPQPWTQAT